MMSKRDEARLRFMADGRLTEEMFNAVWDSMPSYRKDDETKLEGNAVGLHPVNPQHVQELSQDIVGFIGDLINGLPKELWLAALAEAVSSLTFIMEENVYLYIVNHAENRSDWVLVKAKTKPDSVIPFKPKEEENKET